jgi:hypothetical protein
MSGCGALRSASLVIVRLAPESIRREKTAETLRCARRHSGCGALRFAICVVAILASK